MEPFKTFTGVAAALDKVNVDTDQIIPKQFLKRIERSGFGQYLFYDWRFRDDGAPNPEFILNRPPFDRAQILVCGDNFGCGSSREHAPWAIADFGIKVLISTSFADIFYSNCFKNGLLPVVVDAGTLNKIFSWIGGCETPQMRVDLENLKISDDKDTWDYQFDVDPFRKRCLLEGLDDIALTLEHEDKITAYEKSTQLPVILS